MDIFTQTTLLVGRIKDNVALLLGTGFAVSKDRLIATTTRHVVGNDDNDLIVTGSNIYNLNSYQDTQDVSVKYEHVSIVEIDPLRDIVILKIDRCHGDRPNNSWA